MFDGLRLQVREFRTASDPITGETTMAKGQKKSNKEVRKPKKDAVKTEVVSAAFSKGALSPVAAIKQKAATAK